MPYIGNTIRAADDYRLIDDISSSFNGSTTSFALQVAGSAPVPFPKSPQQVLISVNGVIQEPDPSGSSGFNLVGTNIVFSSAPTNGHAFFGIIYATADYLNAGGNFPAGSLGAPSITFIGDENTGLYRKGGGSIGFVADATEIANTDSNGITISSGNLILGDSAGASSDRVVIGASSDLSIYHDGSHSRIDETGTGNLMIQTNNEVLIKKGTAENIASFNVDGAVELYHDNSKKFETTSGGATITGNLIATGNLNVNDNGNINVGNSGDLQLFHNGTNSFIDSDTGNLVISSVADLRFNSADYKFMNVADNETLARFIQDGAVELYYNGTKEFETASDGIAVSSDNAVVNIVSNATGTSTSFIQFRGYRTVGDIGRLGEMQFINQRDGDVQAEIEVIANGDTNSYFDFKTSNAGLRTLRVDHAGANFPDNIKARFGAGEDLQIYHDGSNSFIKDTGTGVFVVNTNEFHVNDAANNENMLKAIENGAVELYHNNSKKFETLSDGVNVTGTLKVNGSPFTGGKILQVVAAETTNHASTSSSSFVDTNITANITPSSSSSKILVMIDAPFHVHRSNGTSNSFEVKVLRNGGDITDTITNHGTHQSGIGSGAISSNRSVGVLNKIILDSPSSTSQLTYKMQMGGAFSGNTVNFQDGSKSHITLMEVAA